MPGDERVRAPSGTTAPSYVDLLRRAYDLGRADGVAAAGFEPADDPGEPGSWCRGRDGEGFARHLCGAPSGAPPAGLAVNAPLWYRQGFREALSREGEAQPAPAR